MNDSDRRRQLKREVRANVIEWLSDYRDSDHSIDELIAFKSAFPDAPESLYYDAYFELDQRAEDAWWDKMEKTIEGDVIRRALANDND